jgi:DNA-binding response OmpR family regulator
MDERKREQIRRTLRNMAEAHASMIEFMEQALELLNEELALDPFTFWYTHKPKRRADVPAVDHELFTVTFRGRTCFLGNTLPFRFISRLARRPNVYVANEDLLSDVWQGVRSDDATRGVVKRLRGALRRAGMAELAEAIDGTTTGHYALKLRR